jgi:hypothetical protein
MKLEFQRQVICYIDSYGTCKVFVGDDLAIVGKAVANRRCPYDGAIQTIEHVWIECNAARIVWMEFQACYLLASRGRLAPIPQNREELIGYFALGPLILRGRYDKRRWNILYSEAVWIIWKIYLDHQFRNRTISRRD